MSSQPSDILQAISILQQQVQALSIENHELRQQVNTPSSTTASLNADPTLTEILARLSQNNHREKSPTKSERQPDPDKFEGDSNDLDRFTSQLYNKLYMNRDRYPLEADKVGYSYGRLSGAAAKAMQGHWTRGTAPGIATLDAFIAHLERLYADPNKRQRAEQDWLRLRQKNRPFHEFLIEFERLAALGRVSDPYRLRPQLELAINDELRNRLIPFDTTEQSYETYRDVCTKIESRVAAAQSFSSLSRTPATANSVRPVAPPRQTHAVTVNIPAPQVSLSPATGANATPVNVRTTTQGGDRMDLSRVRGPLSETEKQHRRNNNLCLYCGEPGHVAAGCPRKVSRIYEIEVKSGNTQPSENA